MPGTLLATTVQSIQIATKRREETFTKLEAGMDWPP
jgi:hypothetical protein